MTLSKLIFPQGCLQSPKYIFKLIKKLRAGYKFKLENNRIKISRYFNPVNLFSKNYLTSIKEFLLLKEKKY